MPGPLPPSPLVSTQWLADHLGSQDLVVIDASVVNFTRPDGHTAIMSGHERYVAEGHIPGAVFADLIEDLSDPAGAFAFTRPSAERFAAAAGALGIGPETTVVVYDRALGQWASRLWWLLRSFGHDAAAVLDGGLTTWLAEEREIRTAHVEPTPAHFVARERPELWVDKGEVEAIVRGEIEAALVCASPPADFRGETAPRPRPGRIPGSISTPAGRLIDQQTRVSLPEAEQRQIFAPVLGAPRIVAYCGGGIAATAAALQLTLLGERSVAVYDGSLNEWAADPSAPLETGTPA